MDGCPAFAVTFDVIETPHRNDDAHYYGKAQSKSPRLSGAGTVSLIVSASNIGYILRINAFTGIDHLDIKIDAVFLYRCGYPDTYHTLVSKLQGVINKMHDHFFDHAPIAH